MAYPDFSPDEQYLLSYAKSAEGSRTLNPYMWSYLIGGSALFGFSAYNLSIAFMVIAFGLVVGFRLYEERYYFRWTPIWRSIIAKFEAALEENSTSVND